jgi:hypothetical protein
MDQNTNNQLAKLIADQLKPFFARWLKLRDAAAYSGIGKHRLINLAELGEIRGFQDPDSGRHDWVFDRLSIDQYRENQEKQEKQIRQKALEIMRRK